MKDSTDAGGAQEVTVSNTSGSTLDSEKYPILPKGQSGYAFIDGRARMQLVGATMDQLASRLSDQLDVTVIDATGLAGKYDFGLYWVATDDDHPNLFSAVESQLGLRLQSRKTAVPIIVIDHLDCAPNEN